MKALSVHDIAKLYAPKVGSPAQDVLPFVRDVISTIAEICMKMQIGDRLILSGLGSFEVRASVDRPGEFKHWKTDKLIARKRSGQRLCFRVNRSLKMATRSPRAEVTENV